MARGAEPGSATTSFFICTGTSTALDGQYTAFGRVVDGMAAVEAIEKAPRNDETPIARIDLRTIGSRRSRYGMTSANAKCRVAFGDLQLALQAPGSLVTFTTTPTRYSTLMRSPGSSDSADDRFGPDPRRVELLARIVDVGEHDLPRHLAVDADRLNPPQHRVARTL